MVRIGYAFFCEDIREEVGGKTSALGLWGASLLVLKFPTVIRSLGFHAYVHNPQQVPTPFRLECTGPFEPAAPEPVVGDLPLDAGKSGTNLNLIFGPVKFLRPGVVTMTLRMQPANQEAIEAVYELAVGLANDSASAEPH